MKNKVFLEEEERKKKKKRKREGGKQRGPSVLVRRRREKICVSKIIGFNLFICMFAFGLMIRQSGLNRV